MLTASSTTPVVTIGLDAAQQGEVKVGDPVSITLPNNGVTPGVISQISRVASASSSSNNSPNGNGPANGNSSPASGATITVLASLTHPRAAGKLNQAPVTVTHHRQRVQRADGAGKRAAGADRWRVCGGGDRPGRSSPGEGDAGSVR